jgi:hypothetical protein
MAMCDTFLIGIAHHCNNRSIVGTAAKAAKAAT